MFHIRPPSLAAGAATIGVTAFSWAAVRALVAQPGAPVVV